MEKGKITLLMLFLALTLCTIFGQTNNSVLIRSDIKVPLYIGIDNIYTFKGINVADENLDVSIKNGGNIEKLGNNKYRIRVKNLGGATVIIKDRSTSNILDSIIFPTAKVRDVTWGFITFENKIEEPVTISADNYIGIHAYVPDDLLRDYLPVKIKSFSITTEDRGYFITTKSKDSLFSQQQKFQIKNCPCDGKIYVEDIVATFTFNNTPRDLGGMTLKKEYFTLNFDSIKNNIYNVKRDTIKSFYLENGNSNWYKKKYRNFNDLRIIPTLFVMSWFVDSVKHSMQSSWSNKDSYEIKLGKLEKFLQNINDTLRKLNDGQLVDFKMESDFNGKSTCIQNKYLSVTNQTKIALVIGNSNYSISALKNPVNDANAMSEKLKVLDYEVIEITDANLLQMKKAISQYGALLAKDKNTIGLFYYAGHGLQVGSKNYLIPVDADIKSEADVPLYSLDLDNLISTIEYAGNSSNIIILDACRNNPFQRSFRGGPQSSGLAPIKSPSGTIIAFATAPGSTANDGDGTNGLYTQELLNAISIPGLQIEEIFKVVRGNVKRKSNYSQIPWENSALEGEIYFIKTE